MKTDEQVLEEWISDEIKFDAGPCGLQFTKKDFSEFCQMFLNSQQTGDIAFPELDRVFRTRDEARKALQSCGWPDAKIDSWMKTFMSAQNFSKYTGTDEVATALRLKAVAVREQMGWSATPYTI
jgi:hypothetical protein